MSNVDVSRAFHGVSNEKLSRAASASVGGRKSHADITGRRAGNNNSALGYATHDSFISAESKQPLSTTALYLPPKGHDSASNSFHSSGTDSPPARRRADTVIPPGLKLPPTPAEPSGVVNVVSVEEKAMEKNSSPSASPPPAKDVGECSVGPLTTTGVLMVQDVDQVTSGAYDSAHSRANSNLPLTPMLSREFSAFSGTDAKTNAVRSVALPSNQRDNSEIRKKQRRKMKRVRKRKSKMTSVDRKRHAERREKRQARLKHRPSASMQKLPAVLPKSEEITPPLANFTRPTSAAHFSPPPKSKQEPEHFTRSVSPSLSEPREVAKKDEIAAARQPLDEPKEVVAGAGAAAVLALRQAKAEPGKLSLSSSRTSCSSAEERQKGRADQSRSCSSRSYSYSHSRSLHSDRYQAGSSYSDSYSYSYSDSVSFDPRTAVLPFKKGFTNAPPKRLFTDVKFRLPQKLYLEPYAENAFIYEWNLREGCWNKVQTTVVLFPEPFSHGNMRASYYIIDMNRLNCPLVAKRYLKKTVDDSQYFDDVSMHSISGHWARLFNAAGPPKKVKFIPAAVLELPDRPLILALEPQLDGTFKKYNNNCGYVPRDARWTPQAFSHFTYHASNHELLIVDIQGVDDIYTDPQILSPDGEGYGRGNLGAKGIQRFIESHKCNGVCKHLGLPPINAKPTDPKTKQGVVEGGKSKDVVAIESERLPPKVYVKSEQHISTSPTPVAQLAPYPATVAPAGYPVGHDPKFLNHMRKALTRTQSTYFGHQAGMVSVTGVPSSTTSSSQSPSLPTTINMGVMLPGRSPMSMSGGQMQFSPSPPVERYPSSHGSNGRHYRSAPPVLIAVEEGKSSEDISIKRIRKHK